MSNLEPDPPFLSSSYRFSLGVILYNLLVGMCSHPYINEAKMHEALALPDGPEQCELLAETVTSARGVMWPDRLRDLYAQDAPQLVALVEGLLNRSVKDRAGIEQVRDEPVGWASSMILDRLCCDGDRVKNLV